MNTHFIDKPNPDKSRLRGLYLRNLGAIPFGIATMGVLNIFTPLELFKVQKAFFFEEGGWVFLPFVHPVVLGIISILQYLIQRPIAKAVRQGFEGKNIGEDLWQKAGRRLLNLPFLLTMTNLLMWIFIPGLFVVFLNSLTHMPHRTSFLFFFRSFMIGMVASAVSFFLVEDYVRKHFVAHFFPRGRLSDLPGTFKISIKRRIRVLYMSGTSVPMIILVGTLAFTIWKMEGASISAQALGLEILTFTMILCGIFVMIALGLNALVGRSVLNPIQEMLDVVGQVRDGDLKTRIRVISNDELGILGDAGNDMLVGLQDREKIRDTFGRYVTPEIRDEILSGRIPLNGEIREATLLFSDLRDFTRYVEENNPEEVIRSMRAYFTAMQEAIHTHQGLVLQYVGDEVEAVFGVPLQLYGHADKAVLAALEMRKSLECLNRVRTKDGKIPFRHGIGIHSGSVLAGNTGSEDRLSYALIGNTVNLASRIQDLTKVFQCDILISEAAARKLRNTYNLQKKPAQVVKGFSRPVTVYRLLPPADAC